MRRYLFPFLAVAISVLALELVLQAAALLAPGEYQRLLRAIPGSIPDPRLGTRPNPDYPGRDNRGFRNTMRPSQVAIVGMGDSQTYGDGVSREEAWPQQLEALARQPVYNMGYPGWGPTHSLLLMDEAFALKPKLIIEAFYSGNDLYDVFRHVYREKQLSELKTSNRGDSTRIAAADAAKTMITELYQLRRKTRAPWERSDDSPGFLGKRLKVYQLFLVLRELVGSRAVRQGWESSKSFAEHLGDRDLQQIVERGDLRTILTPKYRWLLLNLSDPRIAEGHRIALQALQRMNERAGAAQTEFLVMLIPTKELVYRDAVRGQPDSVSKVYAALLENEAMFRQSTQAFLDAHGIKWFDVLAVLQAQLRSRPLPYPASAGGHPTASGQRAIAEAAFAELKRLRFARE